MTNWKKSCHKGLWMALALLLALPTASRAQANGQFSGTVLDQTGAVVPGAMVTVKNERTGEERTTTSNKDGYYVITELRPSLYTLRANFGQFAPLEYTGLQLVIGQDFALDLQLQPAGLTETVTVTAKKLMLQAPGAQNSGTGTWQEIRFSGRAVEQNVIRYDGIEGSAIIDAAPGNLNGEVPSPFKLQASLENVQEFPRGVRHRNWRAGERHHQVRREPVPRGGLRVPP
jgi:hypothetical protein